MKIFKEKLLKASSNRSSESGFTLIEIMVVVIILGILASIIVPKIMDRPDQARVIKAKQDIRVIESALNLYKLDNFKYPSTQEGLEIIVGKYLDKVPKDPWGREYLYLNPGVKGSIDIYTLGADGTEGGEGIDSDIGNWNIND